MNSNIFIKSRYKEIYFKGSVFHLSALIIGFLFFLQSMSYFVVGNTKGFVIFTVVGFFIVLILLFFPSKPPKKMVFDSELRTIRIVNYFPKNEVLIEASDLSRVDWEINWHSWPVIHFNFFNKNEEEIYTFPGLAVGMRDFEKSDKNLSEEHKEMLGLINSFIKEIEK